MKFLLIDQKMNFTKKVDLAQGCKKKPLKCPQKNPRRLPIRRRGGMGGQGFGRFPPKHQFFYHITISSHSAWILLCYYLHLTWCNLNCSYIKTLCQLLLVLKLGPSYYSYHLGSALHWTQIHSLILTALFCTAHISNCTYLYCSLYWTNLYDTRLTKCHKQRKQRLCKILEFVVKFSVIQCFRINPVGRLG